MAGRWLLAVLLALLLAAGCQQRGAEGLTRIAQAEASAQIQGRAVRPQTVVLPFRWDAAFPGQDGRVGFRVDLPPAPPGASARALLLERVGAETQVAFDDAPLQRLGHGTSTSGDASKEAHRLPVPEGARLLRVDMQTEAVRADRLAPVLIGPAPAIDARYAMRRAIDGALPIVYATSLLLMGGLAARLWMRQHEELYGCFALAALFGSLRHLDTLLPEPPLPWQAWGMLLAVAYVLHLMLIGRFVLLGAGGAPRSLARLSAAVLAGALLLAVLSYATRMPALWTGGLWLLVGYSMSCFVFVLRRAFKRRSMEIWVVLGGGTLLILAGVHDLLVVRTAWLPADREPLSAHALFFFVLILAGIVTERFSASVRQVRVLNRSLEQRIAERERQLADAFEALRAQREHQAALSERQRIMRDIHDGVGSQLVGLLSLVRQPQADAGALEQHVAATLDELRMAVDALQPVHGDLSTVLATLRYRLQPRLQAAGLKVVWDVPSLPLGELPPQAVLQVQRILLEAFTNVIRHADAQALTVRARLDPADDDQTLTLEVIDDGQGLPAEGESPGQGLRIMRARAESIGAALHWKPAEGGGTRVVLQWALQRPRLPA